MSPSSTAAIKNSVDEPAVNEPAVAQHTLDEAIIPQPAAIKTAIDEPTTEPAAEEYEAAAIEADVCYRYLSCLSVKPHPHISSRAS